MKVFSKKRIKTENDVILYQNENEYVHIDGSIMLGTSSLIIE